MKKYRLILEKESHIGGAKINYNHRIDNGILTIDSDVIVKNKDQRCAPGLLFKNGSCVPLHLLIAMANAYNKKCKNENEKITINHKFKTLNPGKCKEDLIKQFSKKLGQVCDNQRCWVNQNFINDMQKEAQLELRKYTFRPKGPQGKFTWLSTGNIQDTMAQYERKYPEFTFLGAVPIDFDELEYLGIRNLNFDELRKSGKTKIGIVFNLDESYKSGSHWVSLYADLNKGSVYFSDSYGIEPERRIRKFMRRIARYCKDKLHKKIDVKHNENRHQYKNSECGVYSINFILRFLNGESFDEITGVKVKDDQINKCRHVYFT